MCLLFAGALTATFLELHSLQESSKWVGQARDVTARLNALMTHVNDVETGERGYLLTEQENFLEPYKQAPALIAADIAQLRSSITDDSQQIRLNSLVKKINERCDVATQAVTSARDGHLAAGRELAVSGKGFHDRVRQDIDAMHVAEQELLLERLNRRSEAMNATLASLALVAITGILGLVIVIIMVNKYVAEMAVLHHKLEELSTTDSMTGLLNQRGFRALAGNMLKLAGRQNLQCALIFADMDGLKSINDTLGHNVGSDAIRAMADTLKTCVRESDLVARWGGDEFVVLALVPAQSDLTVLVDRIHSAIQKINNSHDKPFTLAASIGITIAEPNSTKTIAELLSESDQLMYAQKRQNKLQSAGSA
jgi:diguanylate cyclase (GGDEF)-like protein